MSVEMYLHIDGVEGDARDREHKGWIEIISCDWGIARSRTAGAKPATYITGGNEMSLVKSVGVGSADLLNQCASGVSAARAQVSIVPAVGKREVKKKYVLVTMEDVAVRSIALNGALDHDFVTETIGLRFRRMSFEYFLPVSADANAPAGSSASRTFRCDFAAQTSSRESNEA